MLEMAVDYGNIGAYSEAVNLLQAAIAAGQPYSNSPLPYYYAGYYQLKQGKQQEAAQLFATAAKQPSGYCFPFRLEELDILGTALQVNPNDSKGSYYIGNLYYYLDQKDKGVACWETAVAAEPAFAQAQRNLGFGYMRAGEMTKAIASYEKSVKADNSDPRVFTELDQLYEQTGKPVKERLALLEKNKKTVMLHDDAVLRLLTLYNETGAYDKGIAILDTRHFHVWEGGGQVHSVYVDAHLLKGLKLLNSKRYQAAIKEFELADEYPDNLEVGRPSGGGHSQKGFYYMGMAYKNMGNVDKAKECFETVVAATSSRRRWGNYVNDNSYYQAQSLKELGRTADADRVIDQLSQNIKTQMESPALVDEFSKFGEDGSRSERLANLHYLNGLVNLYKGDDTAAKSEFNQAIKMNQNLIWPKQFLTAK
jgi:tetratricopeptide (TPR) repeat protein